MIDLLAKTQFLDDIDFLQGTIIVYEDSIPTIGLIYAPVVTRKARYMHVRHHFVRQLVARKIVKFLHVDTALQSADLLTHPLIPIKFQRHLYVFFNIASLSLPSRTVLSTPPRVKSR